MILRGDRVDSIPPIPKVYFRGDQPKAKLSLVDGPNIRLLPIVSRLFFRLDLR
jgi:hypothetical protein